MRIKIGDTVKVIAGADQGATGEVLRLDASKGRVVIDGVNLVKKHQRPSQQAGTRAPVQGGIIEFEAPVSISNVMLVCPHTGEPTRVAIRRDDDGKRIRVSKRSGKDID